jgi:uncharacterized protein YjbI with pentapeptide repeats
MIKRKWIWIVLVSVVVLIFIVQVSLRESENPVGLKKLENPTKQELENQKLLQEIIKLTIENQRAKNFWYLLTANATFLTALVAVFGAIVTIWKQIVERSRQQELDRLQREQDRLQREDESLRRISEKFNTTVAGLGSDKDPIQAASAVSIMSFLKPEFSAYHHQVYLIILSNLKIAHEPTVIKLLIRAFEQAIRVMLEKDLEKPLNLDFSDAVLKRADLSGLQLHNTDLAHAKMQSANLNKTDLTRVRGYKANLTGALLSDAILVEARLNGAILEGAVLHDANLSSAKLKESDLKQAQFHRAKLQSAHFEKADLRHAKFRQADINDAFFAGALLNQQTLQSLLIAYHWENAHFDPDVRRELEKLSEGRA